MLDRRRCARALARGGVTALVAALVTSAAVLAQVQKAVPPPPAPPAAKQVGEKAAIAQQQQAVVKREVGVALVQKAAAVNVQPMVQQFVNQGRPLVRAEVLLVRKACQPSVAELRQIHRQATELLNDVATKLAEARVRPRVLIAAKGKGGVAARQAQNQLPDATKLFREGMADIVKKNLSASQWAEYRAETENRAEFQKRSGVHFLVEMLDRDLCLSDRQRAELTESLSAHWDDGWSLYLDYALLGNQFYPMGVDPYVTPVLDDNQKKVWQTVQRVSGFWAFGPLLGTFANDNDNLEEELGGEPELPKNAIAPTLDVNGFIAPQPLQATAKRNIRPVAPGRDVMKAEINAAPPKKATAKEPAVNK